MQRSWLYNGETWQTYLNQMIKVNTASSWFKKNEKSTSIKESTILRTFMAPMTITCSEKRDYDVYSNITLSTQGVKSGKILMMCNQLQVLHNKLLIAITSKWFLNLPMTLYTNEETKVPWPRLQSSSIMLECKCSFISLPAQCSSLCRNLFKTSETMGLRH